MLPSLKQITKSLGDAVANARSFVGKPEEAAMALVMDGKVRIGHQQRSASAPFDPVTRGGHLNATPGAPSRCWRQCWHRKN